MALKLDTKYLKNFVTEAQEQQLLAEARQAAAAFDAETCEGNDFIGWRTLPTTYDKEEFARIKAAAERIRRSSQVLVVIGIGGSYLGARAAIEFLGSRYYNDFADLKVYFVGNSVCPEELSKVLRLCEGKDVSVNVISKSGTTTEPAVAFRVFKEYMEKRYGKAAAAQRIYATTDKARGTLKELSDREGYETFVVPDDIGGRYSVLTPVGLLPIAVAGVDIKALMAGAAEAMAALSEPSLEKNPAYRYAAIRNCLYRRGKTIELFAFFEPGLTMLAEWLKQLFGESEGKDGKGIFPASVSFSADLHSMGQYIQQGLRNLFETVILTEKPSAEFVIPTDAAGADGLSFLDGKTLDFVNKKAYEGTMLAHADGGVPNLTLMIPEMNAKELGFLLYFFFVSCAASSYLMGVNPFNQPGVEDYKVNMYALLGKPGFEEKRRELLSRLSQ